MYSILHKGKRDTWDLNTMFYIFGIFLHFIFLQLWRIYKEKMNKQ